MGLWKGSSDGVVSGAGKPRTIGPFLGYIMMINMCLGTGFLGVPYAFFYAGYLAAIPTLLFIAFLSWLNCSWLLEVMARAQVCTMNCSLLKMM
jgi:amino acid permease